MGGHGTTYIHRHIGRCAKRPDVLWGEKLNIDRYPDEAKVISWRRRTGGHILSLSKTIEENLADMIETCSHWVLLSGWCSLRKPFLTRNKIRAYCIVRHPLHAYVSYFGHQHPNHCRALGGFNTIAAVEKWCRQWNAIVNDFMLSKNKIIRYEFFYRDLPYNAALKKDFRNFNFDTEKRNHGELLPKLEPQLKHLVNDNFYKIYDSWEI
jgi:hypothetical protein